MASSLSSQSSVIKTSRPAIDVVLFYDFAHAVHCATAFLPVPSPSATRIASAV